MQPQAAVGAGAPRQARCDLVEGRAEHVEPLAARRADRDDPRAGQQLRRLRARPRGVGQVGARDRDHALADAQRREHGGVLARLRHHAVVGGDDHQEQVDAGGAGDHRAHEALVPRHVDDRQPPPGRQPERRVAELDRDAAPALLRQPVGVGPGERADQRRLAVVDVPGGAERQGDAHRLECWHGMSLIEQTVRDWLADDELPLIVRELFADVSPAGIAAALAGIETRLLGARRRAHRAVRGRRRVRARRPAARRAPRGGEAPRAACLGALPRGHAGGPAPPGRRRLSQSAAARGPAARSSAPRPPPSRCSTAAPTPTRTIRRCAAPWRRRWRGWSSAAVRSPRSTRCAITRCASPAGGLWPVPHEPRFDFEATSAGAEWIDRIAAAATGRPGRRRLRRRARRLARRAPALPGRRGQRGLRLGQRPPRPRAGPGGRRRLRVHRELEPRRPGVPPDARGGAGVRGRLRAGARGAVHRGQSIEPPVHPSSP